MKMQLSQFPGAVASNVKSIFSKETVFRRAHVVYVVTDAAFAAATLYLALLLRYEFVVPVRYSMNFPIFFAVVISALLFFSMILGCYEGMVKYTGFPELFRELTAVTVTGIFLYFLKKTGLIDLPTSVIFMMCCLLFMTTGGSRTIPRVTSRFINFVGKPREAKRVLVVGAGACGAMIIKRLLENSIDLLYPVVCLDDDPVKKDLRVCGVRVFGKTDDVVAAARKYRADEILIAIPSAGADAIRRIYRKCVPTGLPVKLFQSVIDIEDFMRGKRSALKEISLEDLLCRESVHTDQSITRNYLAGKTVLVTGGAGSIGSELCRQTLRNGCRRLIIFDINENGLFELNEELKAAFSPERYELVLGSVRDKNRISSVIGQYRPQLVYHAAAHKHVPLSEINPFEVAKNNIFGTKNVIDACKKHGVSKFILISTDKAVNPANVMGASKRIAEMLVQANNSDETEMAAVRFGNVLGSVGSVVPTFKRQIAAGGPVTVTHPDMTRYFMTIPEAVSLVQTAAALASGGEIYVLNMGKPVKILDMANDLIRLSGLEPGRDIEIKFTGLRPGEKLYEELYLDSESLSTTSHSDIFVLKSGLVDQLKLRRDLSAIAACIEEEGDDEEMHSLLFDTIREDSARAEIHILHAN